MKKHMCRSSGDLLLHQHQILQLKLTDKKTSPVIWAKGKQQLWMMPWYW